MKGTGLHAARRRMASNLLVSLKARVRPFGVVLAALFALTAFAVWPSQEGRAQESPAPLEADAPPPSSPGSSPGSSPDAGRSRGRLGGPAFDPNTPPEERLRAYVLTFTPGDHPFFKFGHNAIWIHDESTNHPFKRDLVYNWGMFSFEDPALIPKFFLGRFLYWLDPHPFGATVRSYQREGRGVISQELDLTMDQKLELKRLLEENAKKENKYYKYDYYRDNCSTRVRDMIDRVTGGRVRAASKGPARLDFRQHTSRLTADLLYEYLALNLVMGDLIDKPRTVWDESFIPMEFQKVLRGVTVIGEDGKERPIVKEERTLVEALKPPPLENPPVRWPYMFLVGGLIGGGLAALGRAGVQRGILRALFGTSLSFFGLVWGIFGAFFLAAWAFTDHEVGYRNENILLCVPWAFGLVGTGINVARGNAVSARRTEKLVLAALVSALVAVVVKILPWFDQDNALFLAFFVPFWGGAYYGAREISRKWAVTTKDAP